MKALYFPEYVETAILPQLSPLAQLAFYKLLFYSNSHYDQTIFPAVGTLCKRCNVKHKPTMRKAIKQLVDAGLIAITERHKNNRQQSNQYELTFDKWEQIDAENGITFAPGGESRRGVQNLKKKIKNVENRIDRVEFAQKKLADYLKQNGITKTERDGMPLYVLPFEYKKSSFKISELLRLSRDAGENYAATA